MRGRKFIFLLLNSVVLAAGCWPKEVPQQPVPKGCASDELEVGKSCIDAAAGQGLLCVLQKATNPIYVNKLEEKLAMETSISAVQAAKIELELIALARQDREPGCRTIKACLRDRGEGFECPIDLELRKKAESERAAEARCKARMELQLAKMPEPCMYADEGACRNQKCNADCARAQGNQAAEGHFCSQSGEGYKWCNFEFCPRVRSICEQERQTLRATAEAEYVKCVEKEKQSGPPG